MMRLGFLGCGYNRSHLELLKRRSDVEIAALFSRSLERAKETAATFGGRPYDDYGEMLDREELDAVYVGLPPYAHGDPELRCIDRKLPLFIEKPVALDVETAARIADRAEQSGVFLFPAYKYRYSPLVERLAAELKRESITLADGFYQIDVAPGKDWWRTRAMSGGQMVEQATHIAACTPPRSAIVSSTSRTPRRCCSAARTAPSAASAAASPARSPKRGSPSTPPPGGSPSSRSGRR
jgi:predicted dehydrogenase